MTDTKPDKLYKASKEAVERGDRNNKEANAVADDTCTDSDGQSASSENDIEMATGGSEEDEFVTVLQSANWTDNTSVLLYPKAFNNTPDLFVIMETMPLQTSFRSNMSFFGWLFWTNLISPLSSNLIRSSFNFKGFTGYIPKYFTLWTDMLICYVNSFFYFHLKSPLNLVIVQIRQLNFSMLFTNKFKLTCQISKCLLVWVFFSEENFSLKTHKWCVTWSGEINFA